MSTKKKKRDLDRFARLDDGTDTSLRAAAPTRLTVLEEPGKDTYLNAVAATLEVKRPDSLAATCSDVGSVPKVVFELVNRARARGVQTLASLDLVGHGEPGRLSMGSKAANKDQGAGGTVFKLHASPAHLSLLLNLRGMLRDDPLFSSPTFGVRLLGCFTGSVYALSEVQPAYDGSVLAYALARFLGTRIEVAVNAVHATDFEPGGYAKAGTRSCTVRDDGDATFEPKELPVALPRGAHVDATHRFENGLGRDAFLAGVLDALEAPTKARAKLQGLVAAYDGEGWKMAGTTPLVSTSLKMESEAGSVLVSGDAAFLIVADKTSSVWYPAKKGASWTSGAKQASTLSRLFGQA